MTLLLPDVGRHEGCQTPSQRIDPAQERESSLPFQDFDPPMPSLSQKAFQEDPQGFLMRLEARAMTLFECGYFAYPTDEAYCFSVVHHAKKVGASDSEYFVRPVEGTCTCPFFSRQEAGEYLFEPGNEPYIVPCKHLRGLTLLVRKTRRWLYATGQIRAFCALVVPWMQMLSHLRRERIRQEKKIASGDFSGYGNYDVPSGCHFPSESNCASPVYRGVRNRRQDHQKGNK